MLIVRQNRMFKRAIIGVAIVLGFGAWIYISYFHRPPTADILSANRNPKSYEKQTDSQGGKPNAEYDYYDNDDDAQTPAKASKRKWAQWIEQNNYVSIGTLYDKCDGEDRITVGKVIMLPDPVSGGVKSKTFVNATIQKQVTGGEMYLSCKYNGRELYTNSWDLCHVEDNMKDRVIFCPVKAGRKKFIKDIPIPNYLPKGTYTTVAHLKNQDDDMLGCAFSEFTL